MRGRTVLGAPTGIMLVALLAGAGCGRGGDENGESGEDTAVPVEIVEVTPRDVPILVRGSARVEGLIEVTVSAEVTGVVRGLPVELGDEVREGDVLARLDDRDARADLLAARGRHLAVLASLDQARQDFARAEELHRQGDISDTELEGQRLRLDVARADSLAAESGVRQTELRMERTSIRSPISGSVAELMVELGELVNPGQPAAVVVRLDSVMVTLGLTEEEVTIVEPGAPAHVTVVSSPGTRFPGRVTAVGPRARRETGTYPAEIKVPNPHGRLLPGMVARVTLQAGTERDALVIPLDAVIEEYGEQVVYVVEEERARRRPVRLGGHFGGDVVVAAGIEPGDRLVVLGQANLKEGQSVKAAVFGPADDSQPGAAPRE